MAWFWRRRVHVSLLPWQVAQPDYPALCALCRIPVSLCPCPNVLAYMETCMVCGIVLNRPYQGPQEEAACVCPRCAAQEHT